MTRSDQLRRMSQKHQEQNAAAKDAYEQSEDESDYIIKWTKTFTIYFLPQISVGNKSYKYR